MCFPKSDEHNGCVGRAAAPERLMLAFGVCGWTDSLPFAILDDNQRQRRLSQGTSSNSFVAFLSTITSLPAMGGAVHRASLEKAPDTASATDFSTSLSPLLPSSPSSTQTVRETFIDSPPAAAPLPAMASCAQTPTETVYSTFLSTTGGVVTLTSTQTITGAASTQSSFSTACIASASDGTCSQFTTETIVTTIPGEPILPVKIRISSPILNKDASRCRRSDDFHHPSNNYRRYHSHCFGSRADSLRAL